METAQKKILVALDFSESSARALDEARQLAARLGARVDLVHVAAPPPASPHELSARAPADMRGVEAAKLHLHRLAATLAKEGLPAEPHLAVGAVVMGLLDLIAQLKPELVVVGSHGKNALTRALVGSVAESLIRRSPVPVLVVPSLRRKMAAEHSAWSCAACGYILSRSDSTERCGKCGAQPAHWISAAVAPEPIDAGEPAVGDLERETIATGVANDPAGLFATSPAGTSGYDVNPELRVRY
jgi:nucleotide-binding universal stress UspA family protein